MVKAKLYGENTHQEVYPYALTKEKKEKIYIYLYIGKKNEESNQINKQI